MIAPRHLQSAKRSSGWFDGHVGCAAVIAAGVLLASLTGCGDSSSTLTTVFIAPLESEDIGGACSYDLLLQQSGNQTGVLVIFERADSGLLFEDSSIRDMANSLGYAMIFAHQCNAKSFNDIQPDAFKGPGRMLFVALSQFAASTGHPELATSGVVLDGFSAAGVLALTMTNYAPGRVMGAIAYAPGSPHLNILHLTPAAGALKVPTLILANAQDPTAGTTRGHSYFQQGRAAGAPWAFAVQNQTAHCCNITTRGMILSWVPGIVTPTPSAPFTAQFICTPNGVLDAYNETNCAFTFASVTSPPVPEAENGWLPDTASAETWLEWVTNPNAND